MEPDRVSDKQHRLAARVRVDWRLGSRHLSIKASWTSGESRVVDRAIQRVAFHAEYCGETRSNDEGIEWTVNLQDV